MAIKDTSRKPFISDNDNSVFVGIDLPFYKSNGTEGWFASTSTTIEAVKNNIRNLLNTTQGERFMQPTLGLNLRRFIFEQIDEELIISIKDDIVNTLSFWLPFVDIQELDVLTHEMDSIINTNTIVVKILFNIKQDPDTLASVQVTIEDTTTTEETNTTI